MRQFVRNDFANVYPATYENFRDHAASLVADHLERYENEDGYSRERFEQACALRNNVDAISAMEATVTDKGLHVRVRATPSPARTFKGRWRLAVENAKSQLHLGQ